MDSKLENKIWWFIYNFVGVHPDDLDIDWTSPETVELSLKLEGTGEHTVPRIGTPELSWDEFCIEVAEKSMMTDEIYAYRLAKDNVEIHKLWEDCNPADAPLIEEELLSDAKRRGVTFKYV